MATTMSNSNIPNRSSNTLSVFTGKRSQPQLIPPSRPTPRDIKPLSDIDDQDSLRFYIPVIHFYRSINGRDKEKEDPAKVIKAALAEALVYYYPFAGRLREVGPTRKLVVECTGEGPLFAEADADIRLEDYQDFLHPPFPFSEELFLDVPAGTLGVLDSPLLLIQVTRLKCGGFVLAIRLNHTMSDGAGLTQFLNAVAEIARGQAKPSITPVWDRHLLDARIPPRVTCIHREYDKVEETTVVPFEDMVHQSFIFGSRQISTLRRQLPLHLQNCTTVELLAACLWRCYTIALQPHPEQEVRFLMLMNARFKFNPPLVPTGYYGNAFVMPAAISTAKKLSSGPPSYALELIRKAKGDVTEDYFKSVADLMVLRSRPLITVPLSFIVSDLNHSGLDEVDYGWGKPAYGGPATGGPGGFPGLTFFIPCKTPAEGEKGIVAPICLPGSAAMKRFIDELDQMLHLGEGAKFLRHLQTDKQKVYNTRRSKI